MVCLEPCTSGAEAPYQDQPLTDFYELDRVHAVSRTNEVFCISIKIYLVKIVEKCVVVAFVYYAHPMNSGQKSTKPVRSNANNFDGGIRTADLSSRGVRISRTA